MLIPEYCSSFAALTTEMSYKQIFKSMKILKFMIIALVAMCGLNSCSEDCDHEFNDVDYSKSIIGVWSSESETYEEAIRILEDGKFMAFGNKGEGDFYVDGT